jgi:flagellar motor switch protein FliM
MANTFKVLARQYGTTSNVDVYTVPSSTKTLITNIVVSNADTSARTFSITLYNSSTAANVPLTTATTVPARDSVIIDAKTLLETGDIIRISSSVDSQVTFHVTGLEIT